MAEQQVPEQFEGFFVDNADTWSTFHKRKHTPKPFEAHDVDIEIQACGVCQSDVHTIRSGWGGSTYPVCVGHEIVGKVLRVGKDVTLVKPGQRVGVGAQIGACLECKQCKNGNEIYCPQWIDTYGAQYPDGTKTQGGYSSHIRAHEYFVFPIPDALETNLAAPMLCAGITVFSPLVRNGAGPGKKVGIIGLGGLGHFGVMLSAALGAETWAISRSDSKKEDAMKMGAHGYIATANEDWNKEHKLSFDLLICTANNSDNFDLSSYLQALDVHGKFITVGLPEGGGFQVKAFDLLTNGCFMGSSHLGNRQEMIQMLELAAKSGVKSWIEEIPINEEGIHTAVEKLKRNEAKYRYVLTNFDKAFPKK